MSAGSPAEIHACSPRPGRLAQGLHIERPDHMLGAIRGVLANIE
jgi:hypothetical protein